MPPAARQTFRTTLEELPNQKARVPVPFDPDEAWGAKRAHPVGGTVGATSVRGTLVRDGAGWSFTVCAACPTWSGPSVETLIA